jgi:hypothetical protein
MIPVTNFYYSTRLPDQAVGLMHVRSTAITPAAYTDKLNVMAADGQIGPGDLGARAWPVQANFYPGAGVGNFIRVNHEEMKTSWEYTVENQFVEVTDKWDANGTYFYYHSLPAGITQVTILNSKHEPVSVSHLLEGGKLFHTLDGGIYWLRYFADNQFHEELILLRLFR